MLPKYPYYILFTNLNPYPFKRYHSDGEKGLGRGQNYSRYRGRATRRRFHPPHKVRAICPRSRQHKIETDSKKISAQK